MTLEDFKQGFKYYTITYLHDGWKNSFIEKRSVVNRRLYKFNFTITEDDFNSNGFKASTAPKQSKTSANHTDGELHLEPKNPNGDSTSVDAK
jgi:hypothetical protein